MVSGANIVYSFFDLKNSLLDVALVSNICRVNIFFFAQPRHQTIAADVDMVVGKALCKLAEINAVHRCTHRAVELDALLLHADNVVLILDSFQRSDKQSLSFGVRVRKLIIDKDYWVIHVTAGLANPRQEFVKNPGLKLFRFGFVGAANEAIHVTF